MRIIRNEITTVNILDDKNELRKLPTKLLFVVLFLFSSSQTRFLLSSFLLLLFSSFGVLTQRLNLKTEFEVK